MTVVVHIGRRIPRNWFRRQTSKLKGLLSFQENIWNMIKQSMNLGKKKCNASGLGRWTIINKKEIEDLNYEIEWLINNIQGNKEFELEEYNDAMKMYEAFGNIFKKEIPKDDSMFKRMKSKVLNSIKIDEAYKSGYGEMHTNNIANKLLEMGIVTHIELKDDYSERNNVDDIQFDMG